MGLRLRGHKLAIESSTETSRDERSHRGTCICGWEESASTHEEVRREYRNYLLNKQAAQLSVRVALSM